MAKRTWPDTADLAATPARVGRANGIELFQSRAVPYGFPRHRRYAHLYGQAPVFPGAGEDLPTVHGGDGSHDGQPESGSAAAGDRRGVGEAFSGGQAAKRL